MLVIGIDTGTHTGFAVWDTDTKTFRDIRTMKIHKAMDAVRSYNASNYIYVFFEDARQRKYIPNSGNIRTEMGRRQGAGSVKRDASIWEDFLTDEGIPYEAVAPARGRTKLSAESFAALTKCTKKTSEHARDAAMLVWQRDGKRLIDIK